MYSPELVISNETSTGSYLKTNFTGFPLVSIARSKSFDLVLGTSQEQTTQTETWIQSLVSQTMEMLSTGQTETLNWWHNFWERSWIIINPAAGPSDPGFQVGKNYQYFRYMMACNAKGEFPTRFNGGIFTFDPELVDDSISFTPDFRKWSGGTFTAQNQRLLYWPLLKTGDVDILQRKFFFISST